MGARSPAILAAAAAVALYTSRSAHASNLDTIGLTQLLTLDPTLTGAGVTVGQAEADVSGANTFEVNPAVVGQPAALFTFTDDNGNVSNTFTPAFESSHADNVGNYFYGKTGSGVATGVSHVDSLSADYFAGTVVPDLIATNDAVVNQSFIEEEQNGNPLSILDQQENDTVYDNYVDSFGTIIVSAVGNAGGFPNPNAPATAYNVIAVAASPGPSSVGPTIDNGRSKPDITAPGDYTSYTTPLVAGAATILVQAGARGDGGSSTQLEDEVTDFRTIKALLLNGANKQIVTFNRTPTAPLDPTNGAGMLNVYNSYLQLAAGNFTASSIDTTASVGGAHPADTFGTPVPSLLGWDFATLNTSSSHDTYANYVFQPPANVTSYTFTATIDWERQFNSSIYGNNYLTNGVNNLDLFLYDTTTHTLVDDSISTVDNVQDVYDQGLKAGDTYDLEVMKNGGTAGVTPGVVSDSETYSLAFDFSPLQDVWTNPTGGSWSAGANWTGGIIPQNTTDTATFGSAAVTPETVTLDGNWTVGNINFNNTNSYTLSAINGGTLALNKGANTAGITDTLGNHTIAAPIVLSSNAVVTVSGSTNTLTLAGPITGNAGLTIAGAGTVKFIGGLVSVSALSVSSGATLDLTSGTAVINYGSPANDPVASLFSELRSGFNGQTWTGTGIQSSTAAANPFHLALGYADGNVDASTPAGANQIVIRYTLAADANLDGSVGFADLLVVAQNYGQTGKDWSHGNFEYDPNGSVGFADLLLVAQNYNTSLSAFSIPGAEISSLPLGSIAAVPEPGSLALAAAAAAGLLVRRARRPS